MATISLSLFLFLSDQTCAAVRPRCATDLQLSKFQVISFLSLSRILQAFFLHEFCVCSVVLLGSLKEIPYICCTDYYKKHHTDAAYFSLWATSVLSALLCSVHRIRHIGLQMQPRKYKEKKVKMRRRELPPPMGLEAALDAPLECISLCNENNEFPFNKIKFERFMFSQKK